jgi:hypothetical protein
MGGSSFLPHNDEPTSQVMLHKPLSSVPGDDTVCLMNTFPLLIP